MPTRTSFRRQRKFTPGKLVYTPAELIDAERRGQWIFIMASGSRQRAKAYHPSWICNMNLHVVCFYIRSKLLRFAVRNAEYPYVFKARLMVSQVPEKASEWWATCTEIPKAKICELTQDAVIREAMKVVADKTGKPDARLQVAFDFSCERTAKPIALLKP